MYYVAHAHAPPVCPETEAHPVPYGDRVLACKNKPSFRIGGGNPTFWFKD